MKRPTTLWILIFWLAFLAFGGFYGGIAMLLDPSGSSLRMTEVLPLLPISNYLLPGLFLLFVMGFFPVLLIYGLVARPNWSWLESAFPKVQYHWAWAGTVLLGILLAVWLIVEGVLIGFKWAIQYVTAVNGLLILLFVFLPPIKRFFRK